MGRQRRKKYKGMKHLVHIGKKAPKGWKEISAMHLGNGIWAITCEKEL